MYCWAAAALLSACGTSLLGPERQPAATPQQLIKQGRMMAAVIGGIEFICSSRDSDVNHKQEVWKMLGRRQGCAVNFTTCIARAAAMAIRRVSHCLHRLWGRICFGCRLWGRMLGNRCTAVARPGRMRCARRMEQIDGIPGRQHAMCQTYCVTITTGEAAPDRLQLTESAAARRSGRLWP